VTRCGSSPDEHFEDAFAVCDSSFLGRVVADARHLIGRASLTALGR
jgi:hypothetical protein